jgi:hypothetical protein
MPLDDGTTEAPAIGRRSPGAALGLGLLATVLVVTLLLLLAAPAATPWLTDWPRLRGLLRTLLAPALVVTWVALLARGGARRAAMAVALGAACFAVYTQVSLPAGDPAGNRRYVASALALLRDGTSDAAGRRASRTPGADETPPGGEPAAARAAGGVAVAILPAVWLADHLLRGTTSPAARLQRLGDAVADGLAALAAALLFVVAGRLGARPRLAAIGAGIFAFATPHLAVDAGGLWSHGVTVPLELAALILALGEPSAAAAAWAGALGGLALAVRPSSALLSLVVAVALVARRRGDHFDPWGLGGRPRVALLLWAGGFAAVAALAALWARLAFGSALPPPLAHVDGLRAWAHDARGLLLSANRGLFTGAPVLAFAVAGGALAIVRGSGWKRAFYVAAVAAAALYLALAARDPGWWRTMAFGPLRFAELLPLLVLMLLPFLEWLPSAGRWSRIAAAGAFLIALAGSGFVAWRGAMAPGTRRWNVEPPLSEARAWDWSDLQVLRDDDRPRGIGGEPRVAEGK